MPTNTAKSTMWIMSPSAKEATILVGMKFKTTSAKEVSTWVNSVLRSKVPRFTPTPGLRIMPPAMPTIEATTVVHI